MTLRDAGRMVIQPILHPFNPSERRLVVQAALIGALVWVVVFALKSGVHWLFDLVMELVARSPSPVLVLVPLLLGAAGTTAVVLFHANTVQYRDRSGQVHELNDVEGDGLERAIALYFSSEPALEQTLLGKEGVEVRWELPTYTLAGRKSLATLLTLGTGGSGGLEASVALVGESLATGAVKPRQAPRRLHRLPLLARAQRWWLPTDPDDLQTAQLAGIAAAVTTLLGAPFAGAFFAIEVMYRRRPIIEKLLFALIASLVAFFLSNVFAGHPRLFVVTVGTRPPETARYYGVLVAMAVIIALVSRAFIFLRTHVEYWFHTRWANPWQRHLLGAGLTGAMALAAVVLTGEDLTLTLGTGVTTIEKAMTGQFTLMVATIALVAKLAATLATVGSGGSAGLLIPSIFFGAMIAAGLAPVCDLPAALLIVPAMSASLGAVVNVPLAAVFFVVEAFGSPFLIPSLVVLLVAMLLVHDNSIYRTQRETYEGRQILPGYSVRRFPVPLGWEGKTLVDLRVRNRFDVNVIGVIEAYVEDGRMRYQARFNPSLGRPLSTGDTLIVLGEDARLDSFAVTVDQENRIASP